MKLYFSEQDIIDSCCVFAARQHGCHPEDREVDLQFHSDRGVHANVCSRLEHAWFHEASSKKSSIGIKWFAPDMFDYTKAVSQLDGTNSSVWAML